MHALSALFLFGLAATAAGQNAVQTPQRLDADDGSDDILFIVKLQAKELKMEVVPSTNVEFPGTHRRTTVWLTERQNLPDKLQPGVTYRDIGMTLRISSRFENIEQIVREALGEVPSEASSAAQPISKVGSDTVVARRARRPARRIARRS